MSGSEAVKLANGDEPRLPTGEVSSSARAPYHYSLPDLSPDELTPALYREMLTKSPPCRQALRLTKRLITGLIGEYEHDDETIRDFVRYALGRIQGTWTGTMGNGLNALWYGYDVQERVWADTSTRFGNRWLYTKVKPTPAEGYYPKGLITDGHGNLTRIVQWIETAHEADLRLEKAVHYAFEGDGSVWGTACARTAHLWYSTRREVVQMWLTSMERISAPIIEDIEAQGTAPNLETGAEESHVTEAAHAWENASGGSVVIRQGRIQDGQLFPQTKVLGGSGGWENQFSAYGDYAAREIYTALGIPPLLQMEPQHATRAQTGAIWNITELMLLPIAEDYAESALLDQIVRPLVVYNYGEQEDYGHFPVEPAADPEEIRNDVQMLTREGYLIPMNQAHYERVAEHYPGLLPSWKETAEGGGQAVGLPGGEGEGGEVGPTAAG